MPVENTQIRLAARPTGLPKASDWNISKTPLAQPSDGEFLAQTFYLSLDPAMRGWMNEGKSYIEPVALGEVMRCGGVARVIASRHDAYQVGDWVAGITGVQAYWLSDGHGVSKIDPEAAPLPKFLSVLGMPGMTAYFGLLDIGKPAPGETLVVSGAAGAVGSIVGQIGKIKDCRVIGIAGGARKCTYLTEELGFDAAIDYKADDIDASLARHCPGGIDVYFDNIGGSLLDSVLARLRLHARICVCGAISQYNNTQGIRGPSNYLSLLVNRARMEGFVVFDYANRYLDAIRAMSTWMRESRLQSREHIVQGIESFPETLLMLFDGRNFGKLIIQVADPQ